MVYDIFIMRILVSVSFKESII